MSVAENWQAPDWFTARAESQADLRVVIVDGTAADEQQLLRVARAAGIDCPSDHWSQTNNGSAALLLELRAVSAELLPQIEAAIAFDDFVLQPANPLEVRSRIRVIEQRRQTAEPESVPESAVDSDGIEVDPIAHEALVEGRTIRLTAREFALFAYLRARRGRVLSRQLLLSRVWGHRYQGGPRTVDTHIGRLRSKFGGALPIETVRSNGYRLRDSSLGASAAE